ncbi:site-specific DNA-methyltransferase [uncultured Shimia sp.]|uniref:site-specific DNA-methyltransferase n=1 Tax=uncultured Shimia sp. TaxID=573152 RepID=UPI00262B24B9|nr:site-specific DNA-methyltransferase [uncultured Shimia sp.]
MSDEIEKLKMHSPDLTQDNIAKIRALFPGCVTEAAGEDGKLRLAVDFDQLRQELSDSIVEGPQERYHLNWPGKREALITANAPIAKTLRPVRDESVDFDTTQNLFIEGDNLEALKLLQETYLGKVKMIYIDPPYNTGNDFVYDDDFAESSAEFLERSNQKDDIGNRLVANTAANGRFHSDWLSMIYPRLTLARNVLAESGVIIVSIDDTEVANLREVMNLVFGEQNFIATVVWQGGRKNDSRYISVGHDYLLIYARNESRIRELGVKWRERKTGVDEALAAGREAWAESGNNPAKATSLYRSWLSKQEDLTASVTRFKNIDDTGRIYNADKDLGWPGGGGPTFEVLHPITQRPVSIPGTGWRFTEARLKEQIDAGLVEFGQDEKKIPRGKTFLEELDSQVPESIFTQIRTTASQRLARLIGPGIFEYPKDECVIARWLNVVTDSDPDALVLDFFAGSGSTAQAVQQLNAADGGNRRSIMVQLPQPCDEKSGAFEAGYETIAEISKERIRRAGQKILEGECHPDWNKDVGFRVLKIDSSNMADVFYTPDQTTQADLLSRVDNIKPDRTAEDLLFQVLLDWGVDLTLPIRRETVQGKTVFFVADTALMACFDDGISEDLVKELAGHAPMRIVFKDTGFADDQTKINVRQIFKAMSPETEVKAI